MMRKRPFIVVLLVALTAHCTVAFSSQRASLRKRHTTCHGAANRLFLSSRTELHLSGEDYDMTEEDESSPSRNEEKKGGGIFGAVSNFFQELDAFVDDATNRRLGAGSNFYGKRKSNFYGKNDSGKKKDRDVADPTEDYQGPSTAGYFKWMPDESGQLKPVTRMKGRVIERNPSFWDRAFEDSETDEE